MYVNAEKTSTAVFGLRLTCTHQTTQWVVHFAFPLCTSWMYSDVVAHQMLMWEKTASAAYERQGGRNSPRLTALDENAACDTFAQFDGRIFRSVVHVVKRCAVK